MKLSYDELLILNLEGFTPPEHTRVLRMTPEKAYERLKSHTGEDFGYDGEVWRKWFRENDSEIAWKGSKSNQDKQA